MNTHTTVQKKKDDIRDTHHQCVVKRKSNISIQEKTVNQDMS